MPPVTRTVPEPGALRGAGGGAGTRRSDSTLPPDSSRWYSPEAAAACRSYREGGLVMVGRGLHMFPFFCIFGSAHEQEAILTFILLCIVHDCSLNMSAKGVSPSGKSRKKAAVYTWYSNIHCYGRQCLHQITSWSSGVPGHSLGQL